MVSKVIDSLDADDTIWKAIYMPVLDLRSNIDFWLSMSLKVKLVI